MPEIASPNSNTNRDSTGHGRGGIEMWRVSIVLVTAIGFNILDSVIQDEE